MLRGPEQPKLVAGSAFFAFADSEGNFLFAPALDSVIPGEEYFAISQDRALRCPLAPRRPFPSGGGRNATEAH